MDEREAKWAEDWYFLAPEIQEIRLMQARSTANFAGMLFIPVCFSGWFVLTLNMHSFHVSYTILSYLGGWLTGQSWRVHWYHRDYVRWMKRHMG
jgi:hypothetical protein